MIRDLELCGCTLKPLSSCAVDGSYYLKAKYSYFIDLESPLQNVFEICSLIEAWLEPVYYHFK